MVLLERSAEMRYGIVKFAGGTKQAGIVKLADSNKTGLTIYIKEQTLLHCVGEALLKISINL